MSLRCLRIALLPRAIVALAALMILAARPAAAQSVFFSYPPAPPVASPPTDVVVHTSVVRVNTPYMILDGGGNPRQHSWFFVADSTSATIMLQAGVENTACCIDGGGTTFTVTVVQASIPSPPVLGTFTVTQPAVPPPATTNSVTIATTPLTTYRVNITSPGQVPGPFVPFGVYRLKIDGAKEFEPLGAPASVAPFNSAEAGTRWVMNVAAGEALNFAVVGGAPCPTQLGPIDTSFRISGGLGYAANDTGTLTGAGNHDATYVVDTVGVGGTVLTYHLSSAGTGYDNAHNPVSTTRGGAQAGAGSGFTIGISGTVACPVFNTEVSVFNPSHQLTSTFMAPVATSGTNFSIPTAGNTPGAWMIVVDQQPGNPPSSAYRLQKGNFVNTTVASPVLVPGSGGVDPAVYAAWFTDGKGFGEVYIYAPPAVTSVDTTFSRDLYTGHGDFGVTGSQVLTMPTNQTITLGDPGSPGGDVGQYRGTITPPAGYIADPDHIAMPITPDALTTVVIHIRDVTPPVLTLPSDFFAEATSSSGATVTYSASASDFIEGSVSVSCLPGSGTTFPLGPTTVNCSASDSSGNVGTGHFTVTVRDTTPPVLTCPPSITVFQDSAYGAKVTFAPTVQDAVGATSTSTPPSGSVFPLGTTTVNCTAVDAAGNRATPCSFTITVVPPVSTIGVKSTDGGTIAIPGGIGTFGIVAQIGSDGLAKGSVEYQDHVSGMNLKSTTITAIVVVGTHARIFGKATINGTGSNDFVVDVDDLGEPGIGIDTFGIQVSTGYVAGSSVISGGNIQVHN